MVAGGSVICRPSIKRPGILDLSIYCEFCNHVQKWSEAATASGLPSGTIVGKVKFEGGTARDEFLDFYCVVNDIES